MEEIVYIGIGSNQGRREKNIEAALDFLGRAEGITVEKVSSVIETDPQGGPPQGKFLNAVVKIRTTLPPAKLLALLQDIERKLKRARTLKDGPRTIDLDILLYGDEEIDQEGLSVPHPRMCRRLFVLRPLLEIEPAVLDTHPFLAARKDEIKNFMRHAQGCGAA